MPSVIAAAINTAEANSSFVPSKLLKRLVVSIQISSGMLKIRLSVMELGRFTDGAEILAKLSSVRKGKAMEEAGYLVGQMRI